MTTEAHEVAVKLLSKHFGKPLPAAIWSAQREVYGDNPRRPYVITGVYPQRLRVKPHDVPAHIERRLSRSLSEWKRGVTDDQQSTQSVKRVRETVEFYEEELAQFRRWRRQALERAYTS